MCSQQRIEKESPNPKARESRAIGESAEGGDGGGQPSPIYDGVTTTTIYGGATRMSINRPAQHEILKKLAAAYPNQVNTQTSADFGLDDITLYFQLAYLEEHGLAKCLWSTELSRKSKAVNFAKITARGLDLLADDGGLGAVLGVVTIKIHEDTLKQLLEAKVTASDLPEPEKNRLISELRSLPAAATKHLTLKLLDKALESGPQAMQWLGTWIQNGVT